MKITVGKTTLTGGGLLWRCLAFALSVLTPLAYAYVAMRLWDTFVERSLGISPSFAAWYGIYVVLAVLSVPLLAGVATRKDVTGDDDEEFAGEKSEFLRGCYRSMARAISAFALLGWALLFGWITGLSS